MTLYAAEGRRKSQTTTQPALADRPWWRWAWMGLAVSLLGTTGLIRVWQDRRSEGVEVASVATMFPLKELPSTLGNWEARKGAEATLDPRVARIAGSNDSLVRSYVNKETGVLVTVLVLYGKADQVINHTPEVCYPAVGYQLAENIIDEVVTTPSFPTVFRSTVYARKGAVTDRQEVYYAFRNQGLWSPEVPGNWRSLKTSPAIFKVQVQRPAGPMERRHLSNPTKGFLAALLPELEQRIRVAEGTAAASEDAGKAKGSASPKEESSEAGKKSPAATNPGQSG